MPNDYLRPILIALLATAASVALGRAMSRWLPSSVDGKPAAELLRENRSVIWLANAAFLCGLLTGLVLYKVMGFAANDPGPLGVGGGIALAAPMLVVHLAAVWSGRNPREVVAAYALYQRLPAAVLYGLTTLGVIALALALISLRSTP